MRTLKGAFTPIFAKSCIELRREYEEISCVLRKNKMLDLRSLCVGLRRVAQPVSVHLRRPGVESAQCCLRLRTVAYGFYAPSTSSINDLFFIELVLCPLLLQSSHNLSQRMGCVNPSLPVGGGGVAGWSSKCKYLFREHQTVQTRRSMTVL